MKTIITKMSIIGLIVLMMASCKKDMEMSSGKFVNIKTNEITDVTRFSAVVSAYVGAGCDVRGVCWSTSQNPTVSDSHTTDGSGIGSFTSNITGLTKNTTYYVRAYATDSKGTSYGAERNFTTNDAIAGHEYVDLGLPSGLLWAMCNVGADSPEDYGWYFMWGSVTSGGDPDCSWANCPGNGGSSSYNTTAFNTWKAANLTGDVLNSGVDAATANWGGGWRMPTAGEWQELYDNTTSTLTTEDGVAGRKFTSKTDSSKYIFLPAAGYRDGTDVYFAGSRGYYRSSSLSSSNSSSAYSMYFISGYVYPQYDNRRYCGLSVRPVRAQSISASAVTTSSVSNITQTTATCGGNVTSDGGANVTARGICWSTSQNPTVSDSHTTDGSGTGSFTSNITGLTENTTYYVRAYATNSKGTSYGEQKSFTTSQSISVPAVTTAQVSNITQTTATCGGNVTSDGGAAVTARGVCWSVSPNPTVSDSHTTDGSGTGSFTSSITGLTASTTYYVRAYATNSKGTSYGEQKSFTSNFVNGHAYVDFGLPSGTLWATCNVGADSPEDYGWYFMWGSVTEGGDLGCSWANCPGNGGSSSYDATAFNTWKAANLTGDVLNSGVDAATANWGGGWRMPTTGEWKELYGNTTCTWTTEDGVYGRKFKSKTDSSKYIFLPAAGYRFGASLGYAGSDGNYWSSSLDSSNPGSAYYMYFDSDYVSPQRNHARYHGLTVRPVR